MITAEVTFSKDQLTRLTHPMECVGIDWETYVEISQELGESRPLHITYSKGTLILMPITELHELLISVLQSFITFTGVFLRVNITPTGGATIRSKSKLIAAEPDLSYFVSNARTHVVKDYVADEVDVPPDIVVEIDIHHYSDDKFDIYSALGISEFWQYNGERLKIFKLNENSVYTQIERSEQLPILTSEILTEFLNRCNGEEEQFKLFTDFQDWLQNAK